MEGTVGRHPGFKCASCSATREFSVDLPGGSYFTPRWVEAFQVHDLVDSFSEKVSSAGLRLNAGGHRYPIAGGALHSLATDALVLHRSVMTLCAGGWVAVTPLQLRASLEALLNSLVIWNSEENIEYMAFKYNYFFLAATFRNGNEERDVRADAKAQLEGVIQRLPPTLQQRGKDFAFMSKLPHQYWYQPDFKGPGDVIGRYSRPEIARLYRGLSSSAHAGFMGFRLFREDPDRIHSDPRSDPSAEARSLLVSSLLTLEQAHVRTLVDGLPVDPHYEALREAVVHYGQRARAAF